VAFEINGDKITNVKPLKYLGRIISIDESNLQAIEQQLKEARMMM